MPHPLVVVAVSRCGEHRRASYRRQAEALGGVLHERGRRVDMTPGVVEEVWRDVTHCVQWDADEFTFQDLVCAALGKWVLRREWLDHSCRRGAWCDESSYGTRLPPLRLPPGSALFITGKFFARDHRPDHWAACTTTIFQIAGGRAHLRLPQDATHYLLSKRDDPGHYIGIPGTRRDAVGLTLRQMTRWIRYGGSASDYGYTLSSALWERPQICDNTTSGEDSPRATTHTAHTASAARKTATAAPPGDTPTEDKALRAAAPEEGGVGSRQEVCRAALPSSAAPECAAAAPAQPEAKRRRRAEEKGGGGSGKAAPPVEHAVRMPRGAGLPCIPPAAVADASPPGLPPPPPPRKAVVEAPVCLPVVVEPPELCTPRQGTQRHAFELFEFVSVMLPGAELAIPAVVVGLSGGAYRVAFGVKPDVVSVSAECLERRETVTPSSAGADRCPPVGSTSPEPRIPAAVALSRSPSPEHLLPVGDEYLAGLVGCGASAWEA